MKRSHSKVEKLPNHLKQEVEDKLITGQTYEQISDSLKEQGHDVSYSSVGRYGRKYLNRFESVRIAKQYAALLSEDNVDRPTTELHEANNLLMNQIILETLMEEEKDPKNLEKAARSIAALQNAQIANERLKITARKSAGEVHTAMNLLKEKIFNEISESYPEIANTLILLAEQTEAQMEKLKQ